MRDARRRIVTIGRVAGGERLLLDRLLGSLGAAPAVPWATFDDHAWRLAVRLMTGHPRLPARDLDGARTVLALSTSCAPAGIGTARSR